ncbi:MAG: hypothetical protein DRI46_08395 [Chloroflexi bacterium]|nr:MAG: hypothetical protein DRI46_08395 [Chloroflexota bacterium]
MTQLYETRCTVTELDQLDGTPTVIVANLPSSPPFPYNYRQTRAETAYDFHPINVLTAVPASATIKENMRMVFPDGQNFRIHSVNPWPMVSPQFLEIILHGDGA